MSPRRQVVGAPPGPAWHTVQADDSIDARPPRDWRLLTAGVVAAVLMVAALVVGVLIVIPHERHHRITRQEVAVLDVARSFTVEFMSPDPTGEFGANRYVDRMTAQVTGDFGQWWEQEQNAILIQVAKGPQIEATVLAAGLERWNDDGSADVLVVVRRAIKDEDGNTVAEPTERVLETLRQEGDRWKISNLSPVA